MRSPVKLPSTTRSRYNFPGGFLGSTPHDSTPTHPAGFALATSGPSSTAPYAFAVRSNHAACLSVSGCSTARRSIDPAITRSPGSSLFASSARTSLTCEATGPIGTLLSKTS